MNKTIGILGGLALLGAAGYAVVKSQREESEAQQELTNALKAQLRREHEAAERDLYIEQEVARRTQCVNNSQNKDEPQEEQHQTTIYSNYRHFF